LLWGAPAPIGGQKVLQNTKSKAGQDPASVPSRQLGGGQAKEKEEVEGKENELKTPYELLPQTEIKPKKGEKKKPRKKTSTRKKLKRKTHNQNVYHHIETPREERPKKTSPGNVEKKLKKNT